MTDKQLDHLLRATDQIAALPPSFTRDVWRDIEHRQIDDSRRLLWLAPILEFLSLPKPRLAVCALAVSIGIFSGIRAGTKSADPVAIYAHSINPLAPAITP